MSWPATLGVALLTALSGMFAAGYTGNLAASWYRISSFEGQAGYFVVAIALGGLLAGLILGVVAARVTGGFLPATGAALGSVLALTLLIGGAARLLADVPPRIDGDTLLLALEYRWPAAQAEAPAADPDDAPHVRLGSVSGSVERRGELGAFWLEDLRREEGRWISPAAVEVFTERGKRAVWFFVRDSVLGGARVPLPRRPGSRSLEWSDWLPLTSQPDGPEYRFRAHRASQPIRTEHVGPFEIQTSAYSFWLTRDRAGRRRLAANASIRILHAGEPVSVEHPDPFGSETTLDRATAVAVVAGPSPALLACMDRSDRPCFLLVTEEGGLRSEFVASLQTGVAGHEITSDPVRFELSRQREWLSGQLDRQLFEEGRVYRLGSGLLDTRGAPRAHRLPDPDGLFLPLWEAPVALSPDGASFVRLATLRDSDALVLAVSDLDGGNLYTLPVDPARMPYTERDAIGPAWVMEHFEWVESRDRGGYRLAERRPLTVPQEP